MRRAPPITPAIISAKRLLEVGLVFGKGLGVFSSGEGLGGTVMGLSVFTVSLVVITVALLDELEPFAEAFTEDVGLVALDSDVESGPFAVAFTETVVEVLVYSDSKRLLGVVVFSAQKII